MVGDGRRRARHRLARPAAPGPGPGRRPGGRLRRRPGAGRAAGRRTVPLGRGRAPPGGSGCRPCRASRARRAGRRGAALLAARVGAPCSTCAGCAGRSASSRAAAARTRRSADAPLAAVLADDTLLGAVPEHIARPALRVAGVLAAGRVALAAGGTAEDVLWAMWQRSGLAGTWARLSAGGGPSGAVADRDLDAVVALFDAAAGFVDRLPSADPRAFLDHLSAQELPGDTGAARAPQADTVRLLTAHASKGLEWDLVCVAGVQEGVWPDLRERGTLLGAEELVERAAGTDAGACRPALARPGRGAAAVLRRLHAGPPAAGRLGRAGRARRRRRSTPSRFLDLVVPPRRRRTRPLTELPRSLTLPALVADLRRAVVDPHDPGRAPRRRPPRCCTGSPPRACPAPSPAVWWGLPPLSDDAPLVAPDDVGARAPVLDRELPPVPAAVGARRGRRRVAARPPGVGRLRGARGGAAGRRRAARRPRPSRARRRARPARLGPRLVRPAASARTRAACSTASCTGTRPTARELIGAELEFDIDRRAGADARARSTGSSATARAGWSSST